MNYLDERALRSPYLFHLLRLLSAGAKVCLSDVLLEDGRETAEELGERFGRENVAFVKCDVRDSSEWGQLWEAAEAHLGGAVTVLVNNAGVSPTKDWKMCLDVNFTGLANGAFLAIEKMDRRKVRPPSPPPRCT